LLFVVQPMVGKMILPLFGGTPAVWSACMVFFQAALLGGYTYAHVSTRSLGVRRQAMAHLGVLALPLVVLPLGLDRARWLGAGGNPVLEVLILLLIRLGVPFLVLSATAPMLQMWFAHTGHRAARDPYFLYGASNLGSMLALLSYPTLIEPTLALRDDGWLSQTRLWALGYLALAALTVLCALSLRRRLAAPTAPGSETTVTALAPRAPAPLEPTDDALTCGHRLRWVTLAFVPSSLLLGVTTHVTTDIAAVPLLWVLPLAIYLLSFILTFGRWPARLDRAVAAVTLPVILVVLFLMVSGFRQRIWITALWHFLLLLMVALACHGELARGRPSAGRLTEFYLLISVGGALGGLFNALVAPAAFSSLAEYPLAMVLASVLVSSRGIAPPAGVRSLLPDLAFSLGVGALALVLYSGFLTVRLDVTALTPVLGGSASWIKERLNPLEDPLNSIVMYGPPLIAGVLARKRPLALGAALTAVLLVAGVVEARHGDRIRQARSFFGVLRISRSDEGYIELRHGTTLHGRQSLDPDRRGEPLSYYHRAGPIGQVFTELARRGGGRRVAVIGLGTGTLAAYARPGDAVTFYEIDRLVRDIAFDPTYFTYVTDARDRGAMLRVELGDGRVRLDAVRRERPAERYDVIVVDAFTSDAIPVHLLTREALRLYLAMLREGGLLALHISNRYVDLAPVAARLAEDAQLGGRLIQHDDAPETEGASRSTWVVLAPTVETLGRLADDERWTTLEADPRVGTWTDDFHNVLSVFKW
jgi:SAM-dependent methyltransferase